MPHIVKVLDIQPETYDTIKLHVEKPQGFHFVPGHSIMVAINKPGKENEKRPFTFTSLNTDPYLEFIMKLYTNKPFSEDMSKLIVGDTLILAEMFGSIRYAGPGVFIAAGTGITPFLAIFRQLVQDNQLAGNSLIYSNKTEADIIAHLELKKILGKDSMFVLTRESKEGYFSGKINPELLKTVISKDKKEYVCGPFDFIIDIRKMSREIHGSKNHNL